MQMRTSDKGHRRHAAFGRSQRGQSLVEMAVACIVLVPLVAGVMLLGQYIHIKQQTQSAARAAAWAATVDPGMTQQHLPSNAVVQRDLRARQFADSKDKLRSDAAAPAKFGDAMLTTFAGRELLKPNNVALTVYKQEAAPSYLDKALGVVGKVTKSLGNLPPNTQGLVTAEVHARSETITDTSGNPLTFLDPLDTHALDFSAKTVLLADAWDAAGGGEDRNGEGISGASNRTVRSVIRPLVPTALFGDKFDDIANKVIDILGKIPIINKIFTPGFDQFHLGRMAPDVVPADKLVPYGRPR
jgi:hypothetical protein